MQRLAAVAIVMLSGTFFSTSFAQNFDSTGAAASNTPAASPVMTNDQFKSTVQSLSKQTKSNLSQQVDQELIGKGSTSGTETPPPVQPTNTPQPDAGATSSQNSTGMTTTPAAPPPAAMKKPGPNSPASGQGAPAQSQIYTGFGGAQPPAQKNETSGTENKTNSNWNVGY
jgi:hypothetical protein